MKQNQPLVSMIITSYNYGDYVSRAIESALSQTYENVELVVINDGSTDNTKSILTDLKRTKSFRVINQKNMGIVRTRNKAIDVARGKYMLQLDADDYLDPNYVEETVKLMKPGVDIVYTNYRAFSDKQFDDSNFPEHDLEKLKNANYIHVSSLLRTSAAKKQKFDPELSNYSHEDWDFFLGMCLSGSNAVLCHTTKLHYRQHGQSRNNLLQSSKDKYDYAKTYQHITNKYTTRYPGEYAYVAAVQFAHWYIQAVGESAVLERRLRDTENQLQLVKSSRPWRLRNAIARLVGKEPV